MGHAHRSCMILHYSHDSVLLSEFICRHTDQTSLDSGRSTRESTRSTTSPLMQERLRLRKGMSISKAHTPKYINSHGKVLEFYLGSIAKKHYLFSSGRSICCARRETTFPQTPKNCLAVKHESFAHNITRLSSRVRPILFTHNNITENQFTAFLYDFRASTQAFLVLHAIHINAVAAGFCAQLDHEGREYIRAR